MNVLFGYILFISILCLLYYGIIIGYSGIGTSFSWFWLAAGDIGILICIAIRYMLLHEIEIQRSLHFLISMIIILGFSIFIVVEGIIILHAKPKAEQGLSYIIVLGAQIRGAKIPKTLMKRLDTAVTYLKENAKTIAIVSGGRGDNEFLSEAEAMQRYLLNQGIAQNRILKEDKSKNTFENILYSKPLLKSDSSAAIITNGFHIYRSVHIAKKQGLNQIQALAAPTDPVMAVNYYVREVIGVLKDKLMGNI